jgi:hypothetical protein
MRTRLNPWMSCFLSSPDSYFLLHSQICPSIVFNESKIKQGDQHIILHSVLNIQRLIQKQPKTITVAWLKMLLMISWCMNHKIMFGNHLNYGNRTYLLWIRDWKETTWIFWIILIMVHRLNSLIMINKSRKQNQKIVSDLKLINIVSLNVKNLLDRDK